MRPTPRGVKLIISTLTLALFSLLFSDLILAFMSLTLASATAYSFFETKLRRVKGGKTRIDPAELDVKVRAGESRVLSFKIWTQTGLFIASRKNWLRLSEQFVPSGVWRISLTLNPKLSGRYLLDGLDAVVRDRLGLFEESLRIPLTLRAIAYPRALPWILEALRLVGERGHGLGDAPGRARGWGFEYLWSREYQPGDPIKLVDWKASARSLKLIVKEFLKEEFGGIRVIHDLRARGPITSDENAALLLSTVVACAKAGLPLGLVLKRDEEVLVYEDEIDPVEALKTVLSHVVEHYITHSWNVYELFEPKPAAELSRALNAVKAWRIAEIPRKSMRNIVKMLRLGLEKRISSLIIYVGDILIDSSFLMELCYTAREKGLRMLVLTPKKPWVDAENLEEAYIMYQSYVKVSKGLTRIGVAMGWQSDRKPIVGAVLPSL